jgi:hypothetical protein
MMSTIAIDRLRQMPRSDEIGIAFLFCNYNREVDQDAANLFAALLKQLVQSQPEIVALVVQLHNRHSRRGSKPSVDELIHILMSTCSSYSTVYIVIDVLDECTNRNGVRRQLVDKLHDVQASRNVRLLFTSRFIPEVI